MGLKAEQTLQKINELETITIETIQNETEEKDWKMKKKEHLLSL